MERLWLVAALAARCSAELSAIAVESAETLTVKKFRARYVRHQLPVIIRPSLNAPNWTHLDFKRMCGAGPITRYEVQPELNQWGGLGVGVPMELDKMIEELYAKKIADGGSSSPSTPELLSRISSPNKKSQARRTKFHELG